MVDKEVMYITEVSVKTVEKDIKKAMSILKNKEDDFQELLDDFKKENVNIRNIGCNQIVRTSIHVLNLPINVVISELERIKFDLLSSVEHHVDSSPNRSYLG